MKSLVYLSPAPLLAALTSGRVAAPRRGVVSRPAPHGLDPNGGHELIG